MDYRKSVLDNGITVISETMSSARTITLGLWFNVGSRDEQANQAGLSHLMEHMMFKGTPTRSPLDISMHFDSLGAELNAFTSKEYTCYYARFVHDKLEDALGVLADMVINSCFDQEAIDTERNVVLEEIARSIDQPDDFVFEQFSEKLLGNQPLALPVLGSQEQVSSYMHDDCIAYHRQHYLTGNLVVAAAGFVDHDQLVALCTRLFAPMQQGQKQVRTMQAAKPSSGLVAKQQEIEQAHIVYGFPWYAQQNDMRFAGSILTSIMGGSMSSRLFQEVREKRGLVYTIYATQAAYQDAGMWCVYAGTRVANLVETTQLIREELERVAQCAVTEEELQRNIDLACGQLALSQETTSSHMLKLGKRETLGIPHESLDTTIDSYKAVSVSDVAQVAQQYLTNAPLVSVVSPLSYEQVYDNLNPILGDVW